MKIGRIAPLIVAARALPPPRWPGSLVPRGSYGAGRALAARRAQSATRASDSPGVAGRDAPIV